MTDVMCNRFEGQVVLITGASRGIGAAIARRFAAEGADVAVGYHQSKEAAEAVVAEVEAMGRKAVAIQADLTDRKGAKTLFEGFHAAFDRLDVLVPAAGHAEIKPLEEMDVETWQRSFAIHLDAVLETCKAAYPLLQESKGRIVMLSTVGAHAAFTGFAAVGAAKAGLESLLQYMASEWIKNGVRCNAVSCGTVDTGILERWAIGPQVREFVQSKTVGLGVAKPEDVSPIVAFLAAEESRYIVGFTLVADGGMTLGIDFEEWVHAAYGKDAKL
ncbi:MAG: SDR family oxidoreductase [Deltaproteobacteria bacterium]|nr:SDR family oxidoreductase [Deltaproteobacteria bacterium]